jgi:hypothetical protein
MLSKSILSAPSVSFVEELYERPWKGLEAVFADRARKTTLLSCVCKKRRESVLVVQKRRTVTLTLAVWLRVPLFPVIVTVYVPVLMLLDTVIVSVDFPEVEIETGLRLAVNPVGALVDNVTVSVKPLRAVIVMVEVPEDPLLIVNDAGDAEIEKSGEVTCTVMLMV